MPYSASIFIGFEALLLATRCRDSIDYFRSDIEIILDWHEKDVI